MRRSDSPESFLQGLRVISRAVTLSYSWCCWCSFLKPETFYLSLLQSHKCPLSVNYNTVCAQCHIKLFILILTVYAVATGSNILLLVEPTTGSERHQGFLRVAFTVVSNVTALVPAFRLSDCQRSVKVKEFSTALDKRKTVLVRIL